MKRWLFLLVVFGLIFAGSTVPALAPRELPAVANESAAAPSPAITGEIDQTGYIKGLYISYAALGHADFVRHVQNLVESTELNAVVMDFKGDQALLTFPTQVPLAAEIGAADAAVIQDAANFLKWFKDRRVYTIARIVVFKDTLLANSYPEWAVTDSNSGGVWHDPEGQGWIDPHYEAPHAYNIALAVEAARLGFDEVQFDYVRFPTDGNVGRAQFSLPNTADNRVAAITGLLRDTKAALTPYNVRLGADVFGYSAWVTDDLGIGQHVESLAPYVDVLAPMVYPSTFATGLPGEDPAYKNAMAYPYEIVERSTRRIVQRARAANPAVEVRPWLQDFADYAFDGRTYTPAEIRRQMAGARDGGGRGWLLWDPAVRYTRAALVSAQPAALPDPTGKIPVLAYRDFIAEPQSKTKARTAEQFRDDLERLLAAGFYPINLRDLVAGLSAVPAGKQPVVLTFNDATPDQFRLLAGGGVDPSSAVGVLLAFNAEHPADWPLAGTFFVRPRPGQPDNTIFGTADLVLTKLQLLRDWGFEIGVQPISDTAFASLTDSEAQEALGTTQAYLASWLTGYQATSLALSNGSYPRNHDLVRQGSFTGGAYAYTAVAVPSGGLVAAPRSEAFDPLRIPRIPAIQGYIDSLLQQAQRPGVYYVSAGE